MNWINIENEYPENNQIVLVVDYISKIISLSLYHEDENEFSFEIMNMIDIDHDYCVTHWMPLPTPPRNNDLD